MKLNILKPDTFKNAIIFFSRGQVALMWATFSCLHFMCFATIKPFGLSGRKLSNKWPWSKDKWSQIVLQTQTFFRYKCDIKLAFFALKKSVQFSWFFQDVQKMFLSLSGAE